MQPLVALFFSFFLVFFFTVFAQFCSSPLLYRHVDLARQVRVAGRSPPWREGGYAAEGEAHPFRDWSPPFYVHIIYRCYEFRSDEEKICADGAFMPSLFFDDCFGVFLLLFQAGRRIADVVLYDKAIFTVVLDWLDSCLCLFGCWV